MPYNRRYTQNEVHEILCASERRARPTGSPHLGHPITQHGDGRSNILDKRYRSVILLHATLEETRAASPLPIPMLAPNQIPDEDSRFLTRLDLIRAVSEALNSTTGQIELRKLATERTVKIHVPLDRSLGIQAETASRTLAGTGPPSHRRGMALRVFVLVNRIKANDPACTIHIHTAYPTAVG